MAPASDDGYSSSILVLPWTNGQPEYRDNYKDGPQQFTGQGFFFYNVGPSAQCPELIFPGKETFSCYLFIVTQIIVFFS